MVGFSIFVYTDMLPILFIVLSCISIRNQKPILLSISLASGLLCRQYFIFFVLAVGAYYVFMFWIKKNSTIVYKMLVSCLTSIIPITILIALWNGLSPDNELKNAILTEGYSYHLSYFTVYVCQLFIYLFPVVLISWKAIYKNTKVIIFCLALSPFYWLFPVRTPKILIDSNMLIEDIIFYITFILGLPILILVVKDIFYKLQEQSPDFSLLLDLTIITFLLIMPISYLVWEKYFLLLLPLATVRILLIKYPEKKGWISSTKLRTNKLMRQRRTSTCCRHERLPTELQMFRNITLLMSFQQVNALLSIWIYLQASEKTCIPLPYSPKILTQLADLRSFSQLITPDAPCGNTGFFTQKKLA